MSPLQSLRSSLSALILRTRSPLVTGKVYVPASEASTRVIVSGQSWIRAAGGGTNLGRLVPQAVKDSSRHRLTSPARVTSEDFLGFGIGFYFLGGGPALDAVCFGHSSSVSASNAD